MNQVKPTAPSVPSESTNLLRRVIGGRLIEALRYSWVPPNVAVLEYGVAPADVFELTAGPVTLRFDSGLLVGAASDPSINSVVVWDEATVTEDRLADDPELFPVSLADAVFSEPALAEAIGRAVVGLRVETEIPNSSLLAQLPGEVSLSLNFDGLVLRLGHGVHDGSDDFAVLGPLRRITKQTNLLLCLP